MGRKKKIGTHVSASRTYQLHSFDPTVDYFPLLMQLGVRPIFHNTELLCLDSPAKKHMQIAMLVDCKAN